MWGTANAETIGQHDRVELIDGRTLQDLRKRERARTNQQGEREPKIKMKEGAKRKTKQRGKKRRKMFSTDEDRPAQSFFSPSCIALSAMSSSIHTNKQPPLFNNFRRSRRKCTKDDPIIHHKESAPIVPILSAAAQTKWRCHFIVVMSGRQRRQEGKMKKRIGGLCLRRPRCTPHCPIRLVLSGLRLSCFGSLLLSPITARLHQSTSFRFLPRTSQHS